MYRDGAESAEGQVQMRDSRKCGLGAFLSPREWLKRRRIGGII
jgi:hypothetical protein